MKTLTKVIEYKLFEDCNEELQGVILEKHRYINTDQDWYDFMISNFKEILSRIGFSDIEIEFSGFSSQGSGARFFGEFSFDSDSISNAKEEFKEYLEFIELITDIEKANGFIGDDLHFSIEKDCHRYYHEFTTSLYVHSDSNNLSIVEDDLISACRKFMKHIYSELEREFYYLSSDNTIIETLNCNEYYFNENGDIF